MYILAWKGCLTQAVNIRYRSIILSIYSHRMNIHICIILCIMLWIGKTHQRDEHSHIYQNSNRQNQIRRSVFSHNNQLSLAQSIPASLDYDQSDLIKHIRFRKDLSSIFCQSDDDCKHISPMHVCLYLPSISKSLCLRKPVKSAGATTQYNQMMIYFLVLLTHILIFKLIS